MTIEEDQAYVKYAETLPVYFAFAESAKLVKIGFSSNVRQRIRSLSGDVGLGYGPFVLLGWCIGGPDREVQLHNQFENARVHGEWFTPVPAMADFLASECEDSEPPIRSHQTFRVSTSAYWAARNRLDRVGASDRVLLDFGDGRVLKEFKAGRKAVAA